MGRQDAARPVEVSHALNRFTQGPLPSFFGWRTKKLTEPEAQCRKVSAWLADNSRGGSNPPRSRKDRVPSQDVDRGGHGSLWTDRIPLARDRKRRPTTCIGGKGGRKEERQQA